MGAARAPAARRERTPHTASGLSRSTRNIASLALGTRGGHARSASQARARRGRGRRGHKGHAPARVVHKHGAARHEVGADDARRVQAQVQAVGRREQAADALEAAACGPARRGGHVRRCL